MLNVLLKKLERLDERIATKFLSSIILFCSIPYIALLLYLVIGLHKFGNKMSPPNTFVLWTLAVIGGAIPLFCIVCLTYKLVKDLYHFRLIMILKVYACLVWIFAMWYTLIQIGSYEQAFSGVPQMWTEAFDKGLWNHLVLLHGIFFYCLYLSIITITTVGYGDVVPLIHVARAAVALQALIGVAFVGIIMGYYFSYSVRKCK